MKKLFILMLSISCFLACKEGIYEHRNLKNMEAENSDKNIEALADRFYRVVGTSKTHAGYSYNEENFFKKTSFLGSDQLNSFSLLKEEMKDSFLERILNKINNSHALGYTLNLNNRPENYTSFLTNYVSNIDRKLGDFIEGIKYEEGSGSSLEKLSEKVRVIEAIDDIYKTIFQPENIHIEKLKAQITNGPLAIIETDKLKEDESISSKLTRIRNESSSLSYQKLKPFNDYNKDINLVEFAESILRVKRKEDSGITSMCDNFMSSHVFDGRFASLEETLRFLLEESDIEKIISTLSRVKEDLNYLIGNCQDYIQAEEYPRQVIEDALAYFKKIQQNLPPYLELFAPSKIQKIARGDLPYYRVIEGDKKRNEINTKKVEKLYYKQLSISIDLFNNLVGEWDQNELSYNGPLIKRIEFYRKNNSFFNQEAIEEFKRELNEYNYLFLGYHDSLSYRGHFRSLFDLIESVDHKVDISSLIRSVKDKYENINDLRKKGDIYSEMEAVLALDQALDNLVGKLNPIAIKKHIREILGKLKGLVIDENKTVIDTFSESLKGQNLDLIQPLLIHFIVEMEKFTCLSTEEPSYSRRRRRNINPISRERDNLESLKTFIEIFGGIQTN